MSAGIFMIIVQEIWLVWGVVWNKNHQVYFVGGEPCQSVIKLLDDAETALVEQGYTHRFDYQHRDLCGVYGRVYGKLKTANESPAGCMALRGICIS